MSRPARRRSAPSPRRGQAGRGQGRLVVADDGRGRHRRRAARGARRPRSPRRARRGLELVLVSSGAIAAGLAPLGFKSRPRDLARQQAAASVGQGLLMHRYTAAFARVRHPGRAGAAHRRRRDSSRALPQRLPDLRQAARARRAAGRQRERHGRHHRDPVRRQRPAGGAGRPPRPRRRAGPAVRHRRRLRPAARTRAGAPPIEVVRSAGRPRRRRRSVAAARWARAV